MNLAPISAVHGINLFENAPSCIAHFENMHWTKRAISFIQSFGTLLLYGLHKLSLKAYPVDPNPNFSNDKLIVCIHGLNNSPAQFAKIIEELRKKDLTYTDIYAPHVLQKGNAKLDEMVKPIFEQIEKWASNTSSRKQLVLVGISNGGRIARAIEAKLATSKSCSTIKKLHFISIVGACKGSTLVNLANYIGLSWLMSKNISEEMATTSKRMQQLNQDWEDGLTRGPARMYTFFASPHDWQVPNYDSSLMTIEGQDVRYALVPGHGHNSIVNAVAKAVASLH